MKREYTKEETAEFKRNRATPVKRFGRQIVRQYPASATNQQRGFTPAGSAKLHFEGMRDLSNTVKVPTIHY